jgi:Pentapeptide repeats (8 copies)
MIANSGDSRVPDGAPLDILRSGVGAWNEWRQTRRSLSPSLPVVDLSGADLSRSNLQGVNLAEARLPETTLPPPTCERRICHVPD